MVDFILALPLTCSLYLTKRGDVGAATRGHNDASSRWSDGGFFRTCDGTERERGLHDGACVQVVRVKLQRGPTAARSGFKVLSV